ncbi:MAG: sulfite exporter TauE/SafE family protein [Verrucomicrobia bacterium]|nr:sulfite exporter TauE/SafE family protein [Verrucomicrobiota bacterium]
MSHWEWGLAAVGALLFGISKSGLAGLGVFAIAIFALLFPQGFASSGIVLPMLVCADIVAVTIYRRHAVWAHVGKLMPWVLVGILAGCGLMWWLREYTGLARRLIGATVLVMVGLHLLRRRADPNVPHTWWFVALMGLLAGVTTMMANAAGPVLVLYMLAVGLPKMEFIGTGAWFFLIVNLLKVPFSWGLDLITPETLRLNVVLVPVILVGVIVGRVVIERVNQRVFETVVLWLSAVAGARLLW